MPRFEPDELSPEDGRSWDRFVRHCQEELVAQVDESAFMMSLVPSGEVDIKFAVELGLGIMMNKPIVAVAISGEPVPEGLRRIAHAVIEVGDIDTEAGRLDFVRQLEAVTAQLGINLHSSS